VLKDLRETGVRTVVLEDCWNESGYALVYSDHQRCAYDAYCKCVEHGHRRIAFFGMFAKSPFLKSVGRERYRALFHLVNGLKDAANESGCDFDLPRDTVGDVYRDPCHIERHLSRRVHSAYICHTPELCVMFYAACNRLGLKIGEDVSLLCIDGPSAYKAFLPPPAFYAHDIERTVEIALRQLFCPEEEFLSEETVVPYRYQSGESLSFAGRTC